MNNNYNNLYCDYIGATGTYSITDYIDITSNILNTKIYNVDYKYNNLIRSETENNLINTYIYNSNVGGEIRFYIKNSGIFDINNASGQPYRVKIGTEGKLYLYYNYNAAIGLLETERWVEPINMLIGHNVALGNLNTITGATDLALTDLIIKVKKIEAIVYEANIIRNDEIFYNPNSTYDQLLLSYNKIKASFTYANSIYAGIVGSLGFGITFAIYGFIQGEVNRQFIENNLQYQLNYNSNLTTTEKSNLISQTFNVYSSNLNDMNINLSNLNILNGFINSNITTQQLIPKLKSNEITLNNKSITKFSLDNIDDFIKTQYGIYYDITNGTFCINSTPTQMDYFRVGGQSVIEGDLFVNKRFINTISTTSAPGIGTYGGSGGGDRIVLKAGSASIYPHAIGLNTNAMWLSVPSGFIRFFVNGVNIASVSSTGLSSSTFTGVGSTITQLDYNNITLNKPTYFPIDPSLYYTQTQTNGLLDTKQANLTFTSPLVNTTNIITLNESSITSLTNFYNKTESDARYLRLSGGAMTGQITGVTTLSASTGIFSKVQTTNNTNVGVPSLGVSGSTGDKLIIYPGTASIYPYSMGINTNELWYSVPSGASHKFYVNGGYILNINSTGLGIGTTNPLTNKLYVNGSTYLNGLLTVNAFDNSSGGTKGIIFRDGYNIPSNNNYNCSILTYDHDNNGFCDGLSINAFDGISFCTNANTRNERMRITQNGNVGIGTNDPLSKLDVRGVIYSQRISVADIINIGLTDNYQLNFYPPSSGTPISVIQSVKNTSPSATGFALCLNPNGGNVGIGGDPGMYRLYVEGSSYINGSSTINASLIVNGNITIQDGYAINIGANGTDGRIYRTGGQFYIEADDYIIFRSANGGANGLFNQGTLYMPSSITSADNVSSARYICTGDILSYIVNINGSTHSGWFYNLNKHWETGHAYLNIAIYAINVSGSNAYCWFGRAFLSTNNNGTPPANNGGVILLTTDYRNPTSGLNYIIVTDIFDSYGNNYLKITINNVVFGGNFKIKVVG